MQVFGIDLSKEKFDVNFIDSKGNEKKQEVKNTLASISRFLSSVSGDVILCAEHTGAYGDLLDENIRYLEAGVIDFLIYQNPGLQTNLGISTLVDHIVFKIEIPEKKLLPVEIVIRENIDNYLQ